MAYCLLPYLENGSCRMLRPLWVLLESIKLEEGLSTQLCYGFLKLRVKNINNELVKKRG